VAEPIAPSLQSPATTGNPHPAIQFWQAVTDPDRTRWEQMIRRDERARLLKLLEHGTTPRHMTEVKAALSKHPDLLRSLGTAWHALHQILTATIEEDKAA
jgi:hypothetical protein